MRVCWFIFFINTLFVLASLDLEVLSCYADYDFESNITFRELLKTALFNLRNNLFWKEPKTF